MLDFLKNLFKPKGNTTPFTPPPLVLDPFTPYDPKPAKPPTPSVPQSKAVLTFEQLQRIFPNTPKANLEMYYQPMIDAMARAEINTPNRINMFLAQVGHETGEFKNKITEENLYYTTPSRLPSVFGSSYFVGKNLNDYTRNPEKLANLVYANKGGNGNTASGDGWKFRGRGIIQLTLRDNYQAFKNWSGVDVISNPDLLLDPEYAVLSATHYWLNNGLNQLADNNDFETLTYRINRAKAGMTHRKELLARARAVII